MQDRVLGYIIEIILVDLFDKGIEKINQLFFFFDFNFIKNVQN